MAHLLRRLGAAALKPRSAPDGAMLPALISGEQAMQLRAQFYAQGQTWPFEDVVPGPPQAPYNAAAYTARLEARERQRQGRAKEIADAMARMPALVEEYRVARRLVWAEVAPLDKLVMSQKQIREKYVKRRLARNG